MYLYKEKNQGWAPDLGPKQLKGSTLGWSDVGKAQELSSEYARLRDAQGGGQAGEFGGQQVGLGWKYKFKSCQNENGN